MKHVFVILILAVFQLLGQQLPNKMDLPPMLTANTQKNVTGTQIIIQNKFRVLKIFAAATVGAVFVKQLDEKIDEEYALEIHRFPFNLFNRFGIFGKWYDQKQTYYALGGLALGALGYSWYRSNAYLKTTIAKVVKAYVYTGVTCYLLKISLGRDRPYLNTGSTSFHPFRFDFNASKMSFPSGHTSTVFAMMTVLAHQTSSLWLKRAYYFLAASVGFQRLLYRKHWASDVVFGGALGFCIGELVSFSEKSNLPTVQLQLMPVGFKKVGLAIVF